MINYDIMENGKEYIKWYQHLNKKNIALYKFLKNTNFSRRSPSLSERWLSFGLVRSESNRSRLYPLQNVGIIQTNHAFDRKFARL